jgi:hypothetical protein
MSTLVSDGGDELGAIKNALHLHSLLDYWDTKKLRALPDGDTLMAHQHLLLGRRQRGQQPHRQCVDQPATTPLRAARSASGTRSPGQQQVSRPPPPAPPGERIEQRTSI